MEDIQEKYNHLDLCIIHLFEICCKNYIENLLVIA